MAYVALVGEGSDAETALDEVVSARRGRVSIMTGGSGFCVLRGTNMAREFVRDVKAKMGSGKLFVFRLEEPQEIFEPGGDAS